MVEKGEKVIDRQVEKELHSGVSKIILLFRFIEKNAALWYCNYV